MSLLHKASPALLPGTSRKRILGHFESPAPARESRLEFVPDRLLRVIKFGGTSVADANSILQSTQIAKRLSHECRLVVVVSAMRGVTDKLVEAAKLSATGKADLVQGIFSSLGDRHHEAIKELLSSPETRDRTQAKLAGILSEGIGRCAQVCEEGTLAPEALDFVSGLGECLSAPIFSAVLEEQGVRSEAISATELIVTDRNFGEAEPDMQRTRNHCLARLGNLLNRHVVPVITGFIGATPERVPTTLGRNGSDFSATIVAAAVDADEVIIWTDVNGVMSADPRLVPTARTIAELSYREGSELARLGAKVLHYKTLSVLESAGTPVWIRSTFAPEMHGTRITPGVRITKGGVAMTALRDVSLIQASLPVAKSRNGIKRARQVLAEHTGALFISDSIDQLSVVVRSAEADQTIDALQRKPRRSRREICATRELALIAMVTDDSADLSQTFSRVIDALKNQNVSVLFATLSEARGSSCILVPQADFAHALAIAHGMLE